MLKKINISAKIITVIISIVLVSIFTISYITYSLSKQALLEKSYENLYLISSHKAQRLEDLLGKLHSQSELIKEMDLSQGNFSFEASTKMYDFEGLFVFDDSFAPLFSFPQFESNDLILFLKNADPSFISQARQKFSLEISKDLQHIIWGTPFLYDHQAKTGLLLIKFSANQLHEIISGNNITGLNTETFFFNNFHQKLLIAANSPEASNTSPVKFFNELVKASKTQGLYKGSDQHIYFSIPVPETNWSMVTRINQETINLNLEKLWIRYFLAGLIILALAFLTVLIFTHILTRSLKNLKESVQLLGEGILPEKVEKNSDDEIGQIAGAIDNLVQGLKRTADFAQKIGKGNFDAEFKPLSKEDTLGTALLTMRDSIQEAERKEKERNWIVSGIAEIGEILRSHNELEKLGDEITSFITQKIDAIQGAFYVVNEEEADQACIEMISSYAYNKKKSLNAKFKFAQGLVGQSAIEQDILLRTEIPDNYMNITSGLLGDQKPKCILIVPLITNEKVFGVIEFAGFKKFGHSQINFVNEVSIIIARTIFNIKVNERTKRLLEESQALSLELKSQQEVLRQNAEEMEATQEELKQSNFKLEEQVEEVSRSQKRMQLLLENASEVITIYEKSGSIRYISPSVNKILGYAQKELIGINDILNVLPESVDSVKTMFHKLVNKPHESVTIQLCYKKKSGENIWLEATGTNLLSDPAVHGIIVNSRDITERRRAEQEQRMRSQMQALSENSPDLITRFDLQGLCFYINPVIEQLTGKNPEYFLNKSINEVELAPALTHQWLNIIQEVNKQQEKVSTEMSFPSEIGDRVMQVNAIPEFNEDKSIESILVVSHDITERKAIELEIQSKNRKITESINYAKRIQGSILPNNQLITQIFPESFIYYKAKDVVSGDFPWFMQSGDCYYIASVDCTGHGVPGALISLIGYFLLNDIVRSRKISDPGIILDELDEGVTQTLRQDLDENSAKDGMDISLCKINIKKGEIEYAGAHRPLYIMNQGSLAEIKGNKFAIGGGIYKNQTNFTNHKIRISKGDSIYLCSDGFPDQFGGPDNRKFGPQRLRELISNNDNLKMRDFHKKIAFEWESWKGNNKQTDDVLLIGIKF